jgi:very-short-patch-repair endonuclease
MTKCIKAKLKRPTSLELKMIDTARIQEFPLMYVGDGSVIINGANPDFICTDGRKLLLEVAGRYWHSDSYERQRCAIFSKFGFKVLVVWEEEFKNEVQLVNRIKDFFGGKH